MSLNLSSTKATTAAVVAFVLVAALLLLVAVTASDSEESATKPAQTAAVKGTDSAPTPAGTPTSASSPLPMVEAEPAKAPALLPYGRTKVFEDDALLVAYYGAPGTSALGVLGKRSPDASHKRLMRTAKKHATPKRPVQPVYELIVTIADAYPGKGGDYNHDVPKKAVQRWINAAERNNALVVLDIQTGSSDFVKVAKRWTWALKHPWVGLAIDPEWRMHRGNVPGRVIGHVDAAEVNRVSAWLSEFTLKRGLPEKVFMIHQFRPDMVRRIGKIKQRKGLAMVQHVDGFGTRAAKLSTYKMVAKPKQFSMGFKLFIDEDTDMMGPAAVRKIRPRVQFISYQ